LRQLRHGSRMPDDVSCDPRYRSRSRLLATPSGSTAASPSVSADVEDLLAQRGITVSYEASDTGARPSAWPTHSGSGAPRDHSGPVSVPLAGRRLGWRSHRQLAPAQPESPRRRARKLLRSGPVPRRLVTYRHGSHGWHTGSSCRPSGWRRPPGRLSILGPGHADGSLARSLGFKPTVATVYQAQREGAL
jgi:hypothetical protein